MNKKSDVLALRAMILGTGLTFLFWLVLYLRWDFLYVWPDRILHFWGGAFLAAFFDWLTFRVWKFDIIFKRYFLRILFGLAFVILLSLFWEWYEFLGDVYTGKHLLQSDLVDTMEDFMNDFLGALTYFLCYFKCKK